jgi:uncharacterized protein (TIGR00251 family)
MEDKKRQFHLHDGRMGAAITVRVTPRASKNEIFEILDDGTIKIRLTSPPSEGKANQALLDFLSEILGVPKTKMEIVAGETGKDKLVTISDLDSATVQERILKRIS